MRGKRLAGAMVVAGAMIFMGLRAFGADFGAGPDSGSVDESKFIETLTKPSGDVTLSFTRPGRVVKILVKIGDHVDAGQVLAEQDSSEEQAEYDFAAAQAADNTRVVAEEKIRDFKEAVYLRKQGAKDSVNLTELQEAQLDFETAIAQLALAQFEHKQDAKKLEQAAAVLAKTKLLSPISGVVQQVMMQEGEDVDNQNMKVMQVVNVDPLRLDVPVPFAQALKIKANDVAHVVFSDGHAIDGVVTAVAPVADAPSGTRNVRVNVKNPANWPAGERVKVSFDTEGKVAQSDTK